MNMYMYQHPATQHNLSVLAERGVMIWGPGMGSQACGDVGPGRMLDPMDLVAEVTRFFSKPNQTELSFLITAGPTREAIDPVRYISNHSSGKMGFALAEAAADLGANVTLVAGPVNLPTPKNVKRIDVITSYSIHYTKLYEKSSKIRLSSRSVRTASSRSS